MKICPDCEENFAYYIHNKCYDSKSRLVISMYFGYVAYGRELFIWDYNMGANNYLFRLIRPSEPSLLRNFPHREGSLFIVNSFAI